MATTNSAPQSLRPRTIPNLAIAGVLGLAAVATYYYTLHAVGTTDIDAEVQKVLDSQKASEKSGETRK